jgi:hypothetical protein
MKNKKTALEYFDNNLFSLNLKLDEYKITIEEYMVARSQLYHKCKLLERKQIINASSIGYADGKAKFENNNPTYKGAQDFYNKNYGILNTNGLNGTIKPNDL